MYLQIKRWIDILVSACGLFILFPVFLFLMAAIKLDSKGPVFFRQKRIEQDKKIFYILKFRTMYVDAPKDVPTHLFTNSDQWVTRVGMWLRTTHLDELPQLINILKGEMSIVGPRPALWNQYDLIAYRDRYGVNHLPVGLTGWAQVHGGDEISVAKKAKLDGYYAKRINGFMDMNCLLKTMGLVFHKNSITKNGLDIRLVKKEEKEVIHRKRNWL